MKRFAILIVVGMILFLGTSVLAETTLSEDIQNFVKDVAQSKGIQQENITSVKQVNFNDLPEEINLKSIDETNLAMYKLQLKNKEKPIYVITASENKFKEAIKSFTRKMLLNFGFNGEVFESTFLKSSVGVSGSYEKGYVMMRQGSITGISTSLEVIKTTQKETAEILIYRNGKLSGLRNTFNLKENGAKIDYDTVSEEIVIFEKGDVISVKINFSPGVKLKDINTLLEIATKE